MGKVHYNQLSFPIENATTNILIVHGYGEHIARYEKLAKALNNKGCSVNGFDFRGHGKSSGGKGVISSFDDYLADFDYFYKNVPKQNLKVYAHSMGALVAAYWLITRPDNQIKEVLFSSGLFKLDDSVSPFLRKIAKYLSTIAPWIKGEKLDSSTITRLPEEVKKYDTDPLINRSGTRARTGYELMKAMEFVLNNAHKITTKAMIVQGDADTLTNMSGSEELYEKINSTSKSIHIVKGGYHELLNDECELEYIELVTSFLVSN